MSNIINFKEKQQERRLQQSNKAVAEALLGMNEIERAIFGPLMEDSTQEIRIIERECRDND